MLSKEPGGPASLELHEQDDPEVGADGLLLAVKACGVNYPDVLIIEDKYQVRPPRPFAPGGEISGEIIAVGVDVKDFAIGDHVVGITSSGGMAEKIAIPASAAISIDRDMPWDIAAALFFTYGTSHHALHGSAKLQRGETLLVLGAAGGVGLAAVQLGKAAGARVVAAVSSAEKAELAKANGADEAVIYPTGNIDRVEQRALTDLFKAAVGKGGADVIYDAVGGDYAEAALRAIAWNGRFLVVGFPAGIPKIPLNLALLKACSIIGVFWGAFTQRDPAQHQANSRALLKLWRDGEIAPHISARYPLAEAGRGIADLAERRAMGKVVVTIP
jgi:NADPH2:quinone reductase